MGFPDGSVVKNLPAMQVCSLSREDTLEKEMATHSSILTWETQWTEEPCGLQSTRSQESDRAEPLNNNKQTNIHLLNDWKIPAQEYIYKII